MSTVLTSNMEDYLEAISLIIDKKQAVRPKDISKRLGVNNSSVTGALRSLSEKKMINYAPHDIITLTNLGRENADKIIKKHQTLRRFFVDILRIEKDEADEAACMIEHVITDNVYHRLEQLIEHLSTCPFSYDDIDYSGDGDGDGDSA